MASISPIKTQDNTYKKYLFPVIITPTLSIGGYVGGVYYDRKSKLNEELRVQAEQAKLDKIFQDKESDLMSKRMSAYREYAGALSDGTMLADQIKELYNVKLSRELSDKEYELLGRGPLLIQRWNTGRLTEIPNCIMLYGKDKEFAKYLIRWFKGITPATIKTIDAKDDILEALENHVKDRALNIQKVSPDETWQLLHVTNFADLINPQKAEFETIESVKALMSAASETFHTTILFYAEDPSKLDDIAIETHRVRRFDIDNFLIDKEVFKNSKQVYREYMRFNQDMYEVSKLREELESLNIPEKKQKFELLENELKNLKREIVEPKSLKKYKWKFAGAGVLVSALIIAIKKVIDNKKDKKND